MDRVVAQIDVAADTRARTATSAADLGAPELLMLAALAAAAIAQGGFYAVPRAVLVVGMCGAAVTALAHRERRARLVPLRPLLLGAACLGGAVLVAGAVHGDLHGEAGTVAAVAALVGAAVVAATLEVPARRLVADCCIGLGVFVAASGWLGVAFRLRHLAHPDSGLWRAATTLTYENAAACMLATLSLWAIARLAWRGGPDSPRSSAAWRAATAMLLTGLVATVSRAGIGAFVIGVAVLILVLGTWRVLRAAWPSAVGAGIATAALAVGMSASGPADGVLAAVGLCLGLGVAAFPWSALRRTAPSLRPQQDRRRLASSGLAAVAVVALAGAVLVVAASLARGTVWSARLGLSSSDRSSELAAALRIWRSELLTGVGPNRFLLVFTRPNGQVVIDHFAHNEWVQFGAEHGIIGLAGLLALLVGVGMTLRGGWRQAHRHPGGQLLVLAAGSIAAVVDFLIHSGFDFLWHVPVVPAVVFIGIGLAASSLAPGAERPASDADSTHRSSNEGRDR